jgi:hypothetical protein
VPKNFHEYILIPPLSDFALRALPPRACKYFCANAPDMTYTYCIEISLSMNVRDFELVPPNHFRVPLSVASDLLSRKLNTTKKRKGKTQWNKEQ